MEPELNSPSMFKMAESGIAMDNALEQHENHLKQQDAIAVVGMGCRFPGANSPEEFWSTLSEGRDGIRHFPADRPFPTLASARAARMECGFLNCAVDEFDAKFFGVSPREAKVMDPQQRLLLEVAWEALESANINPQHLRNSNTGVYVGLWQQDYDKLLNQGYPVEYMHKCLGNMFSATASRVSYHLGLAGPALASEIGCSAALYGLHLACEGLRSGSLPLAIVSGVNLILVPMDPYSVMPEESLLLSPDFRCKTFDETANGYARGEAIGAVILKRYSDATRDGDQILALIRGSAVNHDGAALGSTSFGTPNGKAQERVYREALKSAGVLPSQVSYIETHGTGTAVGDPTEVGSIAEVYSEGRTEPLLIGSHKTNMGHSEGASGIVSLIKLILCIQHNAIPPHLNLRVLNPKINLTRIPATIPLKLTPWNGPGRISAMSAFSMTGMNVHVLVQEPPPLPAVPAQSASTQHLLVLSAKSQEALDAMRDNLALFAKRSPDVRLQDIAFCLATGRAQFTHRLALVAPNTEQLASKLGHQLYVTGRAGAAEPAVGFLFSGQGSQYVGMAKTLYGAQPGFTRALDTCAALYEQMLGQPLLGLIWENEACLEQTLYCQPANFCLQYALTQLWQSHGVRPSVVLGHSAGEFAAAVAAKVLSLEDGLRLVVGRSRLIHELHAGSMLALRSNQDGALKLLQEFELQSGTNNAWLDVAAINAPDQVVVSGRPDTIQLFSEFCEQHGLKAKKLGSAHAFHSREMDPILNEYKALAKSLSVSVPSCQYVSSARAALLSTSEDFGAQYWSDHLRNAVQFSKAFELIAAECRVLIEIGAQPVLLGLAASNAGAQDGLSLLPTMRRNEDNNTTFLTSVGKLYVTGASVELRSVAGEGSRKVTLPPYPFQREKYWLDTTELQRPLLGAGTGTKEHPLLGKRQFQPCPEKFFVQEYSLQTLPYITEHKVAGQLIAPGAVFVEAFLAAVREALYNRNPAIPLVLQGVKIENALELAGPCQMRTVLRPSTLAEGGLEYKLSSQRQLGLEQDKWQVHASATFSLASSAPDKADFQLGAQIRGMKELSHEDVYEAVSKYGLEFGPTFRTIGTAWTGSKGLVTKLSLPDESGSYVCHPVLLDAIIQSFALRQILSTGRKTKGIYLMIAIRKFSWMSRPLTQELYAHVSASADDVELYSSDGLLLCRLEGVEIIRSTETSFLRALRSSQLVDVDEYAEVWRLSQERATCSPPSHFSCPNPSSEHAAAVLEQARIFEAEQGWVLTKLNRLHVLFLIKALQELRWTESWAVGTHFDPALWTARIPRTLNSRVVSSYTLALRQAGYLSAEGLVLEPLPNLPACNDEIRAIRARLQPSFDRNVEIQLADKFGEYLPRILSGTATGLNFLFPDDPTQAGANRYYRESESFLLSSELSVAQVLDTVRPLAKDGGQKDVLRILEVGAGSGVTSLSIMTGLRALGLRFHYTYTDISPYFLKVAQEKLGTTDVTYALFNLEADPLAQGFPPNSFDIVVGVHVFHATRDVAESFRNINQLLRPGGRLIFTEFLKSEPTYEFTWGTLDGWWSFDDFRSTSPLLGLSTHASLLQATGYQDVSSIQIQDGLMGSVSATKNTHVPNTRTLASLQKRKWVVFSDGSATMDALTQNLRESGREVVRIGWKLDGRAAEEGRVVDPEHLNELAELLREELGQAEGLAYLWTHLPSKAGPETQYSLLFPLLQLYKAMLLLGKEQLPATFTLVLRGVHSISEDYGPGNPSGATAWGLIKTIGRSELHVQLRIIDLDPSSPPNEPALLFSQLWNLNHEPFIAIRGEDVFVQRLELSKKPAAPLQLPATARFTAEREPELRIEPAATAEPSATSVEVEVRAISLDSPERVPGFSGTVTAIGSKVAGLEVGEQVLGLAPAVPINSHIIVPATNLIWKPEGMTFAEAAAIPAAFVHAYFALFKTQKLSSADRVLIQDATSGVGLAAIQIARQIGAQILVMAASPRQRAYLSTIAGVKHVFPSRATGRIAEAIRAATTGLGVSVLLVTGSSPPSELLLDVCSKGARVVEIGGAVDEEGNGEGMRAAMEFVRSWVLGEHYSALPIKVYPLTHLGHALDRPEHDVGSRVVLLPWASVTADGQLSLNEKLLSREASYLITGGLGDLGLEVAQWMLGQGAESVVLVGRRAPNGPTERRLAEWRRSGVRVTVLSADIAERKDCVELLKKMEELGLPPLKGIVHAAGVLADDWVENQTWATTEFVLRPKVYGAWYLHELTLTRPLQFFVLFSSMASFFCIPNQSNHAAANRFLDALAHYRVAMGLPATSINWGAWSDIGSAANIRIGQEGVAGLSPFTPAQGIRAFERALSLHVTQTGVIDVSDWDVIKKMTRLGPYLDNIQLIVPKAVVEEATVSLETLLSLAPTELNAELNKLVQATLRRTLGLGPTELLDEEQSFSELGVDSLMTMELRNSLLKVLPGLSVTVHSIQENNCLQALVRHFVDMVTSLGGK